jgi:hypothetical protein
MVGDGDEDGHGDGRVGGRSPGVSSVTMVREGRTGEASNRTVRSRGCGMKSFPSSDLDRERVWPRP